MYGGLLKSASAVAIFAAAGLFTSANAADLGGDCCADLEERVAELEATTVRKGNRKVSLAISGYVSHHVMWWDDGTQSDTYIADGGNYGSRWRFTGTAKISPQITAGFLYEFTAFANSIGSSNQFNFGDDAGASGGGSGGATPGGSGVPGNLAMRDSTVWLSHSQLGKIKIGHGSTATDNLNLIDLANRAGAGTPDVELYNGGFILRSNGGLLASNAGLNWSRINRGHESFDTNRRNHVLYETPTLAGFTVQAAVAEDNFWDVALRYAGEFSGIRLAFGVGYSEDTEFNSAPTATNGLGTVGVICATLCDVKSQTFSASGSVLHVATGLFVTASYGNREIEGSVDGTAGTKYTGPDNERWHVAAGLSKNYFGPGVTTIFGEYTYSEGGMEQGAFIGQTPGYLQNTGGAQSSSQMEQWGVGVIQYIDAAAMDVFAVYKNYSAEATGFTGANASLNKGASGISDFQAVIVGTRINF